MAYIEMSPNAMRINALESSIIGPDNVNHPPHYQSESGLEAIDVIEAFTENLIGPDAVYTANILKYVLRWPKKNGIEDLKKAVWYLNKLITKLENQAYQPARLSEVMNMVNDERKKEIK